MAVVCCRRCLLHSSGLSYMLILDSMRLWEVKNKVRPISDWRCTMKPLLTLHVLWVPPHIIQCESFYTSHAMWVPSHTMQCESFYTSHAMWVPSHTMQCESFYRSHAMWVPSHTMQCESFRTPYSVSPFTHHAMRVLSMTHHAMRVLSLTHLVMHWESLTHQEKWGLSINTSGYSMWGLSQLNPFSIFGWQSVKLTNFYSKVNFLGKTISVKCSNQSKQEQCQKFREWFGQTFSHSWCSPWGL